VEGILRTLKHCSRTIYVENEGFKLSLYFYFFLFTLSSFFFFYNKWLKLSTAAGVA